MPVKLLEDGIVIEAQRELNRIEDLLRQSLIDQDQAEALRAEVRRRVQDHVQGLIAQLPRPTT